MNQEMLLWMLGHFIIFGGACITAYIKLIQRVTKVETFISLLGTKAARALHSPDDHLGLDTILDEYLTHNYEMSYDSWTLLHEKCEDIIKNKEAKPSERSLAAILSAVCEHKLLVPGLTTKKNIEQIASESMVNSAKKEK